MYGDYSTKYTEEHHIFGGYANRRLSERYGLKVYLCPEHHRTSAEAVHKDKDINMRLKKLGQNAFNAYFPDKDFREIFGKNYLEG